MEFSEEIRNKLIEDGRITDPKSPRGVVLNTAASLFRRKGYLQTTVRDIGRETGILPGSIFHHYRSKDEILRTVMEESIVLNLERLKRALEARPDLEDRLRTLISVELYAMNGETGEAWSVMVDEWRNLSDQGKATILRLREEYEGIWLEVLREAHQAGIVTMEPDILRKLLAGSLHWTPTWFRHGGGLSLEDLTDRVWQLATGHRP
ncbi:TetR/AcrR family transcriptional regulator [Marinobacter bryozoorum]|uniref:TetR/AcrR family transcriptional regulator n=1 Tax=Marinobacter bryozoorum TaxID=256324 RepID=UPI002003798D|nr:TetR/AcrR family transcriptional regulator [Marinobacter bryozoorum]MCK7542740.1 TetR/AcrR family transcriptional regulator [Marinobacter bryozoorum]